ncbi:hypothetical protein D3C87_1086220 [compost metagenome]
MAIYIPKPEPIEVYQWLKNGDIPGDGVINNINSGKIVGRHVSYKTVSHQMACSRCKRPVGEHGTLMKRVGDLEYVICPGDWVQFHRDERNRIFGYSVITAKALHERYVDLATLPQPPSPEMPKGIKR